MDSERPAVAVTPAVLAAAWAAWHTRHGGRLGPGPAFAEALAAGLAVALPELALVKNEARSLRSALKATEETCDELAQTAIGVGDNQGAGALQFVSGYIADRLADIADVGPDGRTRLDVDVDDEVANLDGMAEASRRISAKHLSMGDDVKAAYWRGRARGLQLAAHNLHLSPDITLTHVAESGSISIFGEE